MASITRTIGLMATESDDSSRQSTTTIKALSSFSFEASLYSLLLYEQFPSSETITLMTFPQHVSILTSLAMSNSR